MKKKIILLSIALLPVLSISQAISVPKGSQYDSRMQTISYNPYDVTKISAMPGYATSIIFKDNETIIDIAVGFNEGWEVIDSNNIVYLKPIAVEQDGLSYHPLAMDWETNLVIRTDKNVYAFDLDIVEEKKKSAYTIKFNYPLEEKRLRDEANRALIKKNNDAIINNKLNELTYPVNWDYSMKVAEDSRTIAPTFTYDDGVRTYLGFDSTKSIPAVFYYQGEEEMMSNTSVKEIPKYTIIVVHTTAERLILRSGEQTVGVINNNFAKFIPSNQKSTEPAIIRGIK